MHSLSVNEASANSSMNININININSNSKSFCSSNNNSAGETAYSSGNYEYFCQPPSHRHRPLPMQTMTDI
jgi:plastocyanin